MTSGGTSERRKREVCVWVLSLVARGFTVMRLSMGTLHKRHNQRAANILNSAIGGNREELA